MKKIKFNKNNKIPYGQDLSRKIGIPSGINFEIVKEDDEAIVLSAPGYGGDPYGSGRLYVQKNKMKWICYNCGAEAEGE